MSAGFQSLKLKVAARPLAEDLERVAAVRRAAPTPVALRLDANGGWSEAEASRVLPELDSEVAVANGRRAAVGEAVGDAAPFTTLRNWEMQGVRDGAGRDLQILGRE